MDSFFNTHTTIAVPSDRSAGLTAALGAAAVVMDRWSPTYVVRNRGGVNVGDTEALVVRCART